MPEKAIVYMDGPDARIFKQLLYELGSEQRVQNAIILYGLLAHIGDGRARGSKTRASEIRASFPKVVGVSYDEFRHILESIEEF